MPPRDLSFVYMTLILPSLFGLTLLGEGVHRIFNREPAWISIIAGLAFLAVVISAYVFFLR